MIDVPGLLSKGCESEAIVGIGVSGQQLRATTTRLLERGCHIRLEGYDSPGALISALRDGRIDGAVRGTLPSATVLSQLREEFAVQTVMRAALLADRMGKPFMLLPVGIDDGRSLTDRIDLVRTTLSYFGRLGWQPSVGVLSKGRSEDFQRGEDIRLSLAEGERATRELNGLGIDASHYTILIEKAVSERDLVLAPDGVTGNLVFRTLHLVGGCEAYGAPIVNLGRVFVDTSRAKADFSDSVMLAAGLFESIG
jgi:putative methanogen marker protein 4